MVIAMEVFWTLIPRSQQQTLLGLAKVPKVTALTSERLPGWNFEHHEKDCALMNLINISMNDSAAYKKLTAVKKPKKAAPEDKTTIQTALESMGLVEQPQPDPDEMEHDETTSPDSESNKVGISGILDLHFPSTPMSICWHSFMYYVVLWCFFAGLVGLIHLYYRDYRATMEIAEQFLSRVQN